MFCCSETYLHLTTTRRGCQRCVQCWTRPVPTVFLQRSQTFDVLIHVIRSTRMLNISLLIRLAAVLVRHFIESFLLLLSSICVVVWLDYGNSTLAGVSSYLLSRLQSVMNAAAQLIFSLSMFQHITPLLRQLHWLKAPERIAFKQSVLVYKCLHGFAPAYPTDELCQVADVEARQRLRYSSSSSLIVSRTRLLTVGDRAFPVAAARIWNSLPDLVTSAPSVAVFRSRLKTHLFNISYPWSEHCSACAVTLVASETIIVLAYF